MKKGVLIGGAVLLAVVMLAIGMFAGPLVLRTTGARVSFAAGPGGVGGPMANLSSDERAKIQNMTDEERRSYFQNQMGGATPGGPAGMRPGGRGGMTVEGEILEIAADTVTIKTSSGGSQVVYRDADTVMAYAKGASQSELAKGDQVLVVAEPEGDNVISAKAIVLK